MSLVIITLESPEEAIGFAGGVEFVNDSAIEVVSVEGCVVTLTAHGVTDWRWLPDPPPRGGRAEADPLSAALARVRASAAQLGRTIEEWESKFGRNQENLR